MPRKAKESKIEETNIKENKVTKNKPKSEKKVSSSEVKVPKKTNSKKTSSKSKVSTEKNSAKSVNKDSSKKANSKKNSSKNLKNTKKVKNIKKKKRNINIKRAISPKLTKKNKSESVILEYYDLPYRYNKTVIKALAQNPNTLFVYWEISDEDKENFIKKYGENFFNITKPVLIVHNLTDKYSTELEINDFANNWYISINDAKCQYVVELGRRPIEINSKISTDYLYITSSNIIESPNDHVLFYNQNDYIYFKNIHTNKYTKKVIKPFLKHICGIYENLNLSKDVNSFDFKNPSSQNPSSNVL